MNFGKKKGSVLTTRLRQSLCLCGKRDSNPHAFRHRNLNPARLPIPSFPRILNDNSGLRSPCQLHLNRHYQINRNYNLTRPDLSSSTDLPDPADDIFVNPDQKISAHAHTDQFRNGKCPPDQIHITAERQQIGNRQKHAELSGNRNNHAVYTISQGLEHTSHHNTIPCKAKAQANSAQSRHANLQKLRCSIKQPNQRTWYRFHHKQTCQHDPHGIPDTAFHGSDHPLSLSRSIIVGRQT